MNEEQEPKIVIDSDWKEQVQKEKELESQAPQKTPPESAAGPEAESPGTESPGTESPGTESPDDVAKSAADLSPPEASFTVLVSMLFSQAMSLLGQIPGPDGKTDVNKPYAKHTIDTLEMLETKTKGNLDEDERQVIKEALHVLRMAFVNTKA